MSGRRPGWVWGGRAAAAIVVLGLACYLSVVGLSKADALAGVLSLLVAVMALMAPYVLPPREPSSRERPPKLPELSAQQSVTNSVVGGHLLQAKDVKAIRVAGDHQGLAAPPTVAPTAGKAPETSGGQYVDGVWVGGNLAQIDGTDGDVTLG